MGNQRGVFVTGVVTYHLARLYTYATLGLIAAYMGTVITNAEIIGNAQKNLSIFAGIIMIIFALQVGGWIPERFGKLSKITIPATLLKQVSGKNEAMAWGVVGLINGLLPCGLVYAALSLAINQNSAINGALIMIAFGIGTIPAMTAFALVMKKISPDLRSRFIKVAAILLVAFGIFTMFRGSFLHNHHSHEMNMPEMNIEEMSGHSMSNQ